MLLRKLSKMNFTQRVINQVKSQSCFDLTQNFPLPLKSNSHREVLQILSWPQIKSSFSQKIQDEAQTYIEKVRGLGLYTHSQGADYIRQQLSQKVSKRYNINLTPNDIFLTKGGNHALQMLFQLILDKNKDNIMVQYPLNYQINKLIEDSKVNLIQSYENENSREDSLIEQIKKNYKKLKVVYFPNPSNPCGNFFSKEKVKQVVEICSELKIPLIADERLLMLDFEQNRTASVLEFASQAQLEIFVINSLCCIEPGLRSGIITAVNIHDDVKFQLYKVMSISLPSSVSSQIASDCLYQKEISTVDVPKFQQMKSTVESFVKQMKNFEIDSQKNIGNWIFLKQKGQQTRTQRDEQARINEEKRYVDQLLEQTNIKVLPGFLFKANPNETRVYASWSSLKEPDLSNVMKLWVRFDQKYIFN